MFRPVGFGGRSVETVDAQRIVKIATLPKARDVGPIQLVGSDADMRNPSWVRMS